jgi:CheY-like chemotaxis protein
MERREKTEEQLMRAQRVECVGSLASGIAHDMNNMLAPISLASELLESEVESKDGKRMLDLIAQSARRGSDLVKQITVFVRGAKEGADQANITKLLQDLERTARATFPPFIRLNFQIADDLPPVVGQATELYQVMLNLAINARDAMPNGGQLTLQASLAGDSSKTHAAPKIVEVVVHDSGTGIPPEIVGRIFDPFFTTKAPGKGTGLGLATVKSILERYGATIQVASTPGQGTRFALRLLASAERIKPAQVDESEAPTGNGERILLVEDELALADILQESLKHAGYSVTLCGDGAEALERFENDPDSFDVVLTDFRMPVMEGRVLVKKLRALSPVVPIILMSGSQDIQTTREELGPQLQILSKPFTISELLRLLRTLLAAAGSPPIL